MKRFVQFAQQFRYSTLWYTWATYTYVYAHTLTLFMTFWLQLFVYLFVAIIFTCNWLNAFSKNYRKKIPEWKFCAHCLPCHTNYHSINARTGCDWRQNKTDFVARANSHTCRKSEKHTGFLTIFYILLFLFLFSCFCFFFRIPQCALENKLTCNCSIDLLYNNYDDFVCSFDHLYIRFVVISCCFLSCSSSSLIAFMHAFKRFICFGCAFLPFVCFDISNTLCSPFDFTEMKESI